MSLTGRSNPQQFASKSVYDALAVDSGEETEEEVIEQVSKQESTEADSRPTKSAIKRAQKLARTEKRRLQKALAKSQASQSPSDASPSDSPSMRTTSMPEVSVPQSIPGQSVQPVPEEVVTNHHGPDELESHTETDGEVLVYAPGVATVLSALPTTDVEPSERVSQDKSPEEKPSVMSSADMTLPLHGHSSAPDAEQIKKRQNVLTRTLWTFIMIGIFLGLLLLGHAYMILLVMLCQTLVYREVTALFSLTYTKPESRGVEEAGGKDPWSKTLNWYFFAVTNYFLYGESIIYYFKHVVFADAQLLPFVTNHRMISFTLYTIGFVGFVMSLKKGYLKRQFGLFCWVHMSLLIIVVSSHFIINNILEGLIWFWVPASLVICNDVFAYIWGITLGRTPLIKLSPKKTVEGFVGAFWSTLIFALIWGTYFMRFDYMICPVQDLGVSAWSSVHCTPNPVFVWKEWEIWRPLAVFLSTLFGRQITTIPYAPYQFHLLSMAFFASLVAPFGGFFASGFKRAFNIKDFGHSIPGHGGMTDRMDCQFLMGVFTYVYYSSLIREHHVTVGAILQTIVSGLTVEEQLELIADLKRYLGTQGVRVP